VFKNKKVHCMLQPQSNNYAYNRELKWI